MNKYLSFIVVKDIMRPTQRLKKKIEKENLWLFILSILNEKKHYGRELRAIVKQRFGFLTGTMTAYKVLYLLNRQGYVSSKKQGKLVYYEIMHKGKDELSKGKKMLTEYSQLT